MTLQLIKMSMCQSAGCAANPCSRLRHLHFDNDHEETFRGLILSRLTVPASDSKPKIYLIGHGLYENVCSKVLVSESTWRASGGVQGGEHWRLRAHPLHSLLLICVGMT